MARVPAHLPRQSQAALLPAADAIALKYDNGMEVVSVVSARRLVAGFDIHSFAVPASTVRIVSISVPAAPITTTKESPSSLMA